MYIYHALINALSTHMIHINLNMIFYTLIRTNSNFRLQSTRVLLHELVPVQARRWPICSGECRSLSVHPRDIRLRQAERQSSGAVWVEWRQHRLVHRHVSLCKLVNIVLNGHRNHKAYLGRREERRRYELELTRTQKLYFTKDCSLGSVKNLTTSPC